MLGWVRKKGIYITNIFAKLLIVSKYSLQIKILITSIATALTYSQYGSDTNAVGTPRSDPFQAK